MEKLVPKYYKEYGIYVNNSKMIPLLLDGLTPVQRRLLLVVHYLAKNTYIDTSKILGDVVGGYHPHNLPADTAVWCVQNKLALGDGNWGSSIGAYESEAAAYRYTKMKSNPLIESIAFEFLNAVPFKVLEKEPEPLFLPTAVPLCLITEHETVGLGFGLKSSIPCFKLSDLIKRLMYLIKVTNKKYIARPNLNGCDILSDESAIETLLKKGEGTLEVSGTYTVDKKNKTIDITSWCPQMTTFDTILNRINKYDNLKLWENKDISFIDISNDKTGTCIQFSVNKQRNVDTIFEQMENAIKKALKGRVHYKIYIVDQNNNVRLAGVDEMLISSYNVYCKVAKKFISDKIKDCDERINELEVIKKIKPHISKALQTNNSIDECLKIISKNSGIELSIIQEVVDKYKIKKLLSVNTDITEIEGEKKELKNYLNNITENIQKKYKEFGKL